ncbi:MAG: hypothetical protein U0I51_22810, partial [Muricomes sp.]|nr:hypothetical protein [Muricomes sp.]
TLVFLLFSLTPTNSQKTLPTAPISDSREDGRSEVSLSWGVQGGRYAAGMGIEGGYSFNGGYTGFYFK